MLLSVNIYTASQITTLERHFNLRSSYIGFLFIANQIGSILSLIAFIYMSKDLHRPTFLAFSGIFSGIGFLICALPYFMTSVPKHDSNHSTNLVSTLSSTLSNSRVPCSHEYDQQSKHADIVGYYIMLAAMIFIGICRGPTEPISIVHIDDNVPPVSFSCYMTLAGPLSVVSSSLVSILGSFVSRVYITLRATKLNPSDADWVGAWWLGFVILGIMIIFFSLPLFIYPRQNPYECTKSIPLKEKFNSIFTQFRNPVLMGLTLNTCIMALNVCGSVAFIPKYIETQYNWPTWKTNLCLGTIAIFMTTLGSGICSSITTYGEMDTRCCMRISVALQFLEMVVVCMCLNRYCGEETFVTTYRKNNDTILRVKTEANVQSSITIYCLEHECPDDEYIPVCGENGMSFKSPCSAGCSYDDLKQEKYFNCTCAGTNQFAIHGRCLTHCDGAIYTMVLLALRCFLIGAILSAMASVKVSCISKTDRTVAMSIMTLFSSLFGFLPSPFLFAYLVDSTCIQWNRQHCGEKGSCYLYNLQEFHVKYFSLQSALSMLCFIFLLVAACFGLNSEKYLPKETKITD
ncbi:solute carrier organic anion transporter family member 3A1 isoform X2 [Octopus sinensis]|nr:solute carrier organic anion transporter family member 3A1 isoform X2 [Octopus sinensis]XP_036358473.1 solute carrier organic anion transporter family member 3A1 isoform X2 [Octopus sinensis]